MTEERKAKVLFTHPFIENVGGGPLDITKALSLKDDFFMPDTTQIAGYVTMQLYDDKMNARRSICFPEQMLRDIVAEVDRIKKMACEERKAESVLNASGYPCGEAYGSNACVPHLITGHVPLQKQPEAVYCKQCRERSEHAQQTLLAESLKRLKLLADARGCGCLAPPKYAGEERSFCSVCVVDRERIEKELRDADNKSA